MVHANVVRAETKRANRKQRRAHLRGVRIIDEVARYDAIKRGRIIDKLLTTLCSAYWAYLVADGWIYLPNAKCNCDVCRRLRKFPSPCVGSGGIFLECWYAKHKPARVEYQPLSEDQAIEAGLRTFSAERRWNSRTGLHRRDKLVGARQCENCYPGQARRGSRYCRPCEMSVRQTLKEEGWSQVRIQKWVRGDDSALEDAA